MNKMLVLFGCSGIAVVILVLAFMVFPRMVGSEATTHGPVVIDRVAVSSHAAQFYRGRWVSIEADPIITSLGGSYERLEGNTVLVLRLNNRRIVISPTRTDVAGDFYINEPVSMARTLTIHADAFSRAITLVYPNARVYDKDGTVFVERTLQ